jgi:hypothetical protein
MFQEIIYSQKNIDHIYINVHVVQENSFGLKKVHVSKKVYMYISLLINF